MLSTKLKTSLFVIGTLVAPGVGLAAATAAPVIIDGTGYEESTNTSCTAANCNTVMTAVPAGMVLYVGYVKCMVNRRNGTNAVVAEEAYMLGNGAVLPLALSADRVIPSAQPQKVTFFGESVKKIFKAGQKPIITVIYNTHGNSLLKCNISGSLYSEIQ